MKKLISLLMAVLVSSSILCVPAAALENVALNKPTAASSVYAAGTTGPANINDGNRSNYFASGGAVLEGTVNGNQFVRIDLQEPCEIDSVVLYTRVDVDDGRYRKNLAVEFSNTVDFAEKESVQAVGNEPVGFKESIAVDVNLKRPYRYVRVVQSAGDSLLVLAEVEVFGEAAALTDEDNNTVPAEYADAAASEYAGPIRLLQVMGVMSGIDETAFGVNKIVSRAQAADAIVKAANPDYPKAEKQPFSDVDSAFWAADTISRAWDLGIIKGDGNGDFRPNDPVSELEAITMMLRALGYGAFLEARNSVSQTISAAKQAGLVKSFQADKNEYIGRGKFAQMLYRMLRSNVAVVKEINGDGLRYETRKCLLEDLHGILLDEGLVKQNRYSHLSWPKPSSGNNAVIGTENLLDPRGILDGLLGYNVTYATQKDQPEQIYIAWPEDNETVTIKAEELDSTKEEIKKGSVRVLRADGKKEHYTLSAAKDIVINGVSYPEALPEDLLISAGTVTLIDNDSDGSYDVADVQSYEMMELLLVADKGEELMVTDSFGKTETLVKENTAVFYVNGSEAKTGKIKTGRVIRLYQSKNGQKSKVVLLDNTISGTAEDIAQGVSVTVGGTVYPYAAGLISSEHQEEFAPGDVITLYLDEENKVEWILKDAELQSGDWIIGFSQKVNLAKSMSDKTQFRIYNQDGAFETLSVADKVFVDGKRISHDELTETVRKNPENYVLEFVRYQRNDSGEIFRLDTMYEGEREDGETMSFYRKSTGGSMVTEVNAIYNGQTYVMPAKGDALTFVIPQIDGEFTDDEEYDYVYDIKQLSHVIYNHNDNGDTTVSSYMLGEDGFPKFFANIKNYKGGSGLNVRLVSDTANMPVLLVERVNAAMKDDITGYTIHVRNLKNGKTEQYFVEDQIKLFETGKVFQEKQEWLDANMWLDESKIFSADPAVLQNYVSGFSDLSFGDIIGCELASDRVTAIERLYRYDKTTAPELLNSVWYSGGQHPKWFFSRNRLQLGTVDQTDKISVTFQTKEGAQERFYLSSFFSTLYVCDNTREKITTENGANISAYLTDQTKFMYLCSSGTPVCIVAYTFD